MVRQELDLMPVLLERGKSAHILGPAEARMLDRIDIHLQTGRISRAPGLAAMAIDATSTGVYVQNAFVATRRDCKKVLFDSAVGTSGTVRSTVGTYSAGTACNGPAPLWNTEQDYEAYGYNEYGSSYIYETLDDDVALWLKAKRQTCYDAL